MSTIIIMRGLPGSGKTTAALEYVETHAGFTVRLSRDDARASLFGFDGVGNAEQEQVITRIHEEAALLALGRGHDVLLDATNLNPQFIRPWFKIAKRAGADVKFWDFPIPIATAIERDANRKRTVGQGVIARMAQRAGIEDDGKLPKAPKWTRPPLPDLTPAAEWDDMLPTAIIVDTDGTLANHEGVRNPYDTSKYAEDTVHEDVARIVNVLGEVHRIIGVSGRDAKFAEVTIDWWQDKANVMPDFMFFRPEGDTRPDDVVKAEIYEQHIRGKYNIVGVFDDRARVLAMWRAKGLTTFAVGDTRNNEF